MFLRGINPQHRPKTPAAAIRTGWKGRHCSCGQTAKTPCCRANWEQLPIPWLWRYICLTQLHPTQHSICSEGASLDWCFQNGFTCAYVERRRFESVPYWFAQGASAYRSIHSARGIHCSVLTFPWLFVRRARARWDTGCERFAADNVPPSPAPHAILPGNCERFLFVTWLDSVQRTQTCKPCAFWRI